MENGAFANAPFSIIFSKLEFFSEFFQCCLKIENDDRSKMAYGVKGCPNIKEFKYLG